jgi:hypothetical protein
VTTLALAPQRLDDTAGGEPTLDELIVDAWEGLAAGRVVGCVVCEGEMAAGAGDASDPLAGRCPECGAVLS